jgi:hypothetical protein
VFEEGIGKGLELIFIKTDPLQVDQILEGVFLNLFDMILMKIQVFNFFEFRFEEPGFNCCHFALEEPNPVQSGEFGHNIHRNEVNLSCIENCKSFN